ncbi:hypothetical protein PAA8504_03140 [Palleronia abyssalis]|uniref:Inner membrane protein YjdF n=1 Tax=Palleronia abyssalis TaxID=1501240 RepID=A0A2R8BYS7_9RHOB|nr:hypothetical protein PAA8504_03140 [Palleronia abyssalis]
MSNRFRPVLALIAMAVAAAFGLAISTKVFGLLVVCFGFGLLLPLFSAVSGLQFPRRLVGWVTAYCFVAFLMGEFADGYEAVPILDILLHVVSGSALSAVGFGIVMLITAGGAPRTQVWILSILAFGFSMMVGAMWEILEFSLDQLFGLNTQAEGNMDTMTDIIANLAGAVYGVIACHVSVVSGRRIAPGGLLLDFVARNPIIYGAWTGRLRRAQDVTGGPEAGLDRAFEGGWKSGSDEVAGEEEVRPGGA